MKEPDKNYEQHSKEGLICILHGRDREIESMQFDIKLANSRVKSAVTNEDLWYKIIGKAFAYGIHFSLNHDARTWKMTTRPIKGRIYVSEMPGSEPAAEALLAFINNLELINKDENQRKHNLP